MIIFTDILYTMLKQKLLLNVCDIFFKRLFKNIAVLGGVSSHQTHYLINLIKAIAL